MTDFPKMVSDPRIQEALKWEPKVGDLTNRGMLLEWLFTPGSLGFLNGGYWDRLESGQTVWYPRVEDLVERMKNHPFKVDYTGRQFCIWIKTERDWIFGNTLEEALLQAFAWIHGLKWEGEWRER